MSEKKRMKKIENTVNATNVDVLMRTIGLSNTINALIREKDEMIAYGEEKTLSLTDEQYQELVASFTLDDADEVPLKEELETYLNEKKDNKVIDNKVIAIEKEIKLLTKKYVQIVAEIKENNPEVYEALQEITVAKLKEIWEI